MGNKEIGKSNGNNDKEIISPNKRMSNSNTKSNPNTNSKSNSNSLPNKIYSEEKINKHVESKKIVILDSKMIGFKLSEIIESRKFFIICSVCGNYFLDMGLSVFVECIKCLSNVNVEKIHEKINELDEKNDEIKYLKTLDKEIKEILELDLSVNL